MILRQHFRHPGRVLVLVLGLIPALAQTPASRPGEDLDLDLRYGALVRPAYLKHYEADPQGRVPVSPYLQVASRAFPACLDRTLAPYDWVINADGDVAVVPETPHPYGRTFPKGYTRPEDQSWKKPGTVENYGHAGAMAGRPGRMGGELLYDAKSRTWAISNKSAHYSRHNPDRTPDQLLNAADLIRAVMDPDGSGWGPVRFLLDYGPDRLRAALEQDPHLHYQNPARKSGPYVVLPAAASSKGLSR